MDETRTKLIEARQLINKLTVTCRQTITFLNGKSAMDERRIKRTLYDIINQSNHFMEQE